MLEQLRENQQLFYEQAIVPLNSGRINHAYLIETNNNEDELVDTYLNEFYKQLLICGGSNKKTWICWKLLCFSFFIENNLYY